MDRKNARSRRPLCLGQRALPAVPALGKVQSTLHRWPQGSLVVYTTAVTVPQVETGKDD